jgi:NDP-sugar pyrophosphorylase family protein
MRAVTLAGCYGTRLSEEAGTVPKPMAPIRQHPIFWHIMKINSAHDIADLVICCANKGTVIKDYFLKYFSRSAASCNGLRWTMGSILPSQHDGQHPRCDGRVSWIG